MARSKTSTERVAASTRKSELSAVSRLAPLKQYRTTIGLLGAVVLVILGFVLVRSRAATSPAGTDTGTANSCVFSDGNKSPAFCSSFDTAYAGAKTQTGDLDPTLWGVSRLGDYVTPSHNACSGGGKTGDPWNGDPNSHYFGPQTPPPSDARVCNGQYVESINDSGGVANIDTYPKQPFDFTNRTGKVVFDVTNDGTGSHGAWPEFVITDEPVPGTRSCSSQCGGTGANIGTTSPNNYVGFSMATGHYNSGQGQTGVDFIFYNVNGKEIVMLPNDHYDEATVTQGCLAGHSFNCPVTKMNHYEVQVSKTRIDIYATDAYSGALDLTKTPLKHVDGEDVPLAFSSGLVWMNHVQYNAYKAVEPCGCGVQTDHSFAWDNLGFDGPKTYRDLGYDVPLNNQTTSQPNQNGESPTILEGYPVSSSQTFSIPDVSWQQTPSKAKVVLNTWSYNTLATIKVVLNGHTADAVTVKDKSANPNLFDAMSFSFPIADAVQGTNTLTISTSEPQTRLSNISLIMVAGAPVPGQTTSPTPTPTPAPTLKPGDVNGDGSINVFDASIVSANWGQVGRARAQGDLNGDGAVNVFDASIVSANWGK